jgi:hypothetical protein
MSDDALSFWDYLREAFYRKVPVPGLGVLPANVMALAALAVLGLGNPGFWFLGAAAEVVYLAGVAGSKRFQKVVQGERLLGAQHRWQDQVGDAVARLTDEDRARYRRLLDQCRSILGISERLEGDSLGNLRDLRSRSLNQLLGIFLRLLASREVITASVESLDEGDLQADIARLEKAVAAAGDNAALSRSLEGTLAIQKRRLENLAKARSTLSVVEAELSRIEQQAELIREESALTRSPEFLSQRLDAVTSAMGETSRFLDEHAELLGNLGVDDAVPPVPDLPQLPRALEEGK